MTTSGIQSYAGPVSLGANTVLSSTGNLAITFSSTVNNAFTLTVNTTGATIFGGVVGGVTPLLSLTTDAGAGATSLAGNVTTTLTQTYNDPVTLTGNAILASTTNLLIALASTVNGAFTLTVNTTAATTFGGVVGGVTPLVSVTTNAGGTTSIAGNMTTTGAQGFGDAVTLAGNVILASTGNLAVALGGTVDGAFALAIDTTGASTLGGVVGGVTPLTSITTDAGGTTSIAGNVTTTGAQNFGDAVTLAGNVTLASTGNLAIVLSVTVDGAFALTTNTTGATSFGGAVGGGIPLSSIATSAGGSVSIAANMTATTGISLGVTTVTSNCAMTPGVGGLSVTGSFSITGGTLTLFGPATVSGAVSIAVGAVFSDSSSSLITSGGNWTNNGTFNSFNGAVTVNGICALTSGGSPFFDLTVGPLGAVAPQDPLTVSRNFAINSGGTYSHNFKTLTLGGALGAIGNLTDSNAVAQDLGAVVISTALKTMTTNIQIGISLTITLTGSLDINGNVLTAAAPTNNGTIFRNGTAGEAAPKTAASGTVIYRNAGGGTIQTYGGVGDYFDLQLAAGSGTYTLQGAMAVVDKLTLNGGTLSLNFDVIVLLDLQLNAGSTLNGNSQNLTIHQNMDLSGGGTFTAGASSVVFVDAAKTTVISGGPTFFNFLCNTDSKIILFQAGQTIAIANGGDFTVTASGPLLATEVKLHSTVANPPPPPGVYNNLYQPAIQWQINIPVTATFVVNNVDVECSFAVRIILPVAATFNVDDWTFNWRLQMPVTASWTHDTNNNGKIDEIEVRVLPGATLNNDFSAFTVVVTGYTVVGYSGKAIPPLDTFYIHLAEGTALDTDAVPLWWIPLGGNNSLKAIPGTNKFVFSKPAPPPFDLLHGERPVDLANPILGYTLSVANGQAQIYAHFSEPVEHNPPGALLAGDFTLNNTVSGVTVSGPPVPVSPSEFLVPLSGPLTPDDIANPARIVATAGQVRDIAGNLLIQALATGHRVSDLGLGLLSNGMMEPMFAHDQTQAGPFAGGIGLISLGGFDGSKWLRNKQDITLQGRVQTLVSPPAPGGTTLWYDIDVPASDRSGGTSTGVWLPSFFSDDVTQNPLVAPYYGFSGLVPMAVPGDTQARSRSEDSAAAQLRNFSIPGTDAKEHDAAVLDFLFQMNFATQILFGARVGSPLAADWYTTVTPWTFDLRDLRSQRGGVQILKNVINPDKGEVTTLQFIQGTAGNVTVTVFDLSGSIIRVLIRQNQAAGDYGATWDGTNRSGAKVARGLYFIKIVGPGIDEIRKVLVVR